MSRFILPLLMVAVLSSGCARSDSDQPTLQDASSVLAAMRSTYDGEWYETLTFVQTTIQFDPAGGVDTTSWFEGIEIPGKLRIDIGSPTSGNTMIFREDSIYVFRDGQLANAASAVHPLLLLGFDVYRMPTDEVRTKLDSLGFDLGRMHIASWQDRAAYVIGTDIEGDLDTSQFWIDAERLVFVRLLQGVGRDESVRQEILFNGYQPLGGGWIAPEVRFYADSTITLIERYHSIEIGTEFGDGFFEPGSFLSADHWFDDELPGTSR